MSAFLAGATHLTLLQLPEENWAEVGTMDLRMAHGACLVLGRLIVCRPPRCTRRAIHVRRVATQAKKVDVVDLEQARVCGSVRRVARQTAFVGLYRGMLEHERPHRVGVTFRADGELSGGRSHLVPALRAVRIVAIAALNEADVNAVSIRPCELCALLCVATVAKLGLRLDQHEIYVGGFVRAMAACATDAIGQVLTISRNSGSQG